MTPHQKAASMVLAFTPIVPDIKTAKECALHEISGQIELMYQINRVDLISKYKEIKNEIEKF